MTERQAMDVSSETLSRRHLFRMGLSVALVAGVGSAGLFASTAEAEAAEALRVSERLAGRIAGPRTLSFYNTHTGEDLTATFWRGGTYNTSALSEINYILRDFRSGDVHEMAPGLLNLLSTLQHRLGVQGKTLQIISGYRSPRTNKMLRATREGGVATKSYHMKGMAMDLRMSGVSGAAIAREAKAMQLGGVCFYPHEDFVHVDVGPVRTWSGA